LEEIGDDELGLSLQEAEIMPIIIIMDAWTFRPLEVDYEEFSSFLDASWIMSFIDPNDHKYENSNFDMIENIGIRYCNAEDIKGYESEIGETFEIYPKSMLCVNDLEKLRVI